MKKVVAFNGSPRRTGNTSLLLKHFMEGTGQNPVDTSVFHPHELNLEPCKGCLRCNVLKRCSISGDDWNEISSKIMEADVLVFASPVYFHHVPAPLKKVIDRFRSFVHVQITETGLIHTPWQKWDKDFVLILTMGSPDKSEADPVIDLFRYITSILGSGNKLHVITATRLAVVKQVVKTKEELRDLYQKMKLPTELVAGDIQRNKALMEECRSLGFELLKE